MAQPYIGEIRTFGFSFAPVGWAACDGSVIPIAQNEVLYTVLGTTYGGDGQTTFGIPDLRGRMPRHAGSASPGGSVALGQNGGSESATLTSNQMPQHTHTLPCSTAAGNSASPVGAVFAAEARGQALPYSNRGTNAQLGVTVNTSPVGGNSHENRPPFQAVNFCIATEGVYPSPS